MNEVNLQVRVGELQAEQIPVLTWGDIFTEGEDGLTDNQKAVLNDYLSHFMLRPLGEDGKGLCPCCRERMEGGVEGAILGMAGLGVSLDWGIAHGEASCSGCGWPYRVYHYNIGGEGEDVLIKRLVLGLPYHPSELKLKQDDEDESNDD